MNIQPSENETGAVPVQELPVGASQAMGALLGALQDLVERKEPPADLREALVSTFFVFLAELRELDTALANLQPEAVGDHTQIERMKAEDEHWHTAFERVCDNLLQAGEHMTLCWNVPADPAGLIREILLVEADLAIPTAEAATAPPVGDGEAALSSRAARRTCRRSLLSYRMLVSEWLKDAELSLYQIRVVQHRERLIESLERRVREGLGPLMGELVGVIEEGMEQLKTANLERSLSVRLLAAERTLTRQARTQSLPPLLSVVGQLRLSNLYHDALDEFERYLGDLAAEHVLVGYRRIGKGMRQIRISLKELVQSELSQLIRMVAVEGEQRLRSFSDELKRSLTMVDPGISTVFSVGRTQLKEGKPDEDVLQSVLEDLDRQARRVSQLQQDLLSRGGSLSAELGGLSEELISKVGQLGDSEHLHRMQIKLLSVRILRWFRQLGHRLLEKIEQVTPRGWRLIRRVRARMGRRVKQLKQAAGLAEDEGVKRRLASYLAEVDQSIEALPGIYRHLFRPQPLEESTFFSGREERLAHAERTLKEWEHGGVLALCVTGDAGCGKSTLLNQLAIGGTTPRDPVWIRIEQTVCSSEELLQLLKTGLKQPDATDLEELATRVKAEEKQRLVFLEDLHRMFLRTVDGFDALREFLLFLVETRERIGWVVTCGDHGWNYLSNVLPLERYFRVQLSLEPLGADALESLIISRHGVSGFQLHFDPTTLGRNRQKDAEKTQAEASRIYFQRLQEMSNGNIRTAIRYWLISIRAHKEGTMEIGDVREFDAGFLKLLPDEDLFYLAALLQHDLLDAASLASVFRTRPGTATLVLDRLRDAGVLVSSESGVRIHPVLYRPVVKALRLRNMIS